MRVVCFIWILSAILQNDLCALDERKADSLKLLLSDRRTASQAETLMRLGRLYLSDSAGLAFDYYSRSLSIARQLQNDTLVAELLEGMGLSKSELAQHREAKSYLAQALEIFARQGYSHRAADIMRSLGLVEYYLGNYTAALNHYHTALKEFIKAGNAQTEANLYQNIGLLHAELNNTDQALNYYKRALAINEHHQNKEKIAALTQNIGLVYLRKELPYLALGFIEKSYKSYQELDNRLGIGISLSNLGYVNQTIGNFAEALNFYRRALTVFQEEGFIIGKIDVVHNIGTSYTDLKKYDIALGHFNESLARARESHYPSGIISNYQAIYRLYNETGDYKKALEFYKLYTEMEDSVTSGESRNRILEMETFYKLEILDNELSLKNTELDQQKRLRYFYFLGIVFLVGLLFLVVLAYIKKKEAEKELGRHKEDLERILEEKTEALKAEIVERKTAVESDRLKSAFLSNMSHELRTPMNAIIAFSNFLREPKLRKEKRDEYINYITSAGEALLGLVDDIIDIAKIEARQLSINKADCNITDLCIELLNVFNELKNRKNKDHINIMLSPESIRYNIIIDTDRQRLRQVMSNLLENALKYTEAGYIEFGYEKRPGDILFFVKDTGIGIPADKFNYIFERFAQIEYSSNLQFGGTGLGLAITKNIVKLLGGGIWVESSVGKGSTFWFNLTYDRIEVSVFAGNEEKKTVARGKSLNIFSWNDKTILIAEDEDLNFKVLQSALARTKAKIVRAENGTEAVEMVKNRHIDLVLMDIQMPEMNGYDATQEIKRLYPLLPVIAQTSFAMEGEKEKCIDAGCNDYLSKPLNLHELMAKIENYFEP